MSLLLVIAFMVCLGAMFRSFVMFDRLLRIEYNEHRENWEQEGRPFGFLYGPPNTKWRSDSFGSWLRSSFAFYRCTVVWPLAPPTWMKESGTSARALRELRVSLATFLAAWAFLLVFFVVSLTSAST